MKIEDLQACVNVRWELQKSNPCHQSSGPEHALLHMTKAMGKVASALNDAQHENREVREDEVAKYLADIMICAARFAHGNVDLAAACRARLAEKFPTSTT